MAAPSFSERLLSWWDRHGRKDLPWQQPRSPYRVWVSEIMLQQTQVSTVIPYFERFMRQFPQLASLAAASEDAVLAQWSGLGYYARARNMHRTARICQQQYAGELPQDAASLEALPGIGRSTAAAIISQAWNQPQAILDGNVKRLLARYAGVDGWPGQSAVAKRLWVLSEQLLTKQRAADYTQALMDLGATVCTRRQPACDHCPLQTDCVAHREDRIDKLPSPRPKRNIPERSTRMLLIQDKTGAVLLERRPASGIWGGLWCFPQLEEDTDLELHLHGLGLNPHRQTELPLLKHSFTHFRLQIRPLNIVVEQRPDLIQSEHRREWRKPAEWLDLGLPKPVRILMQSLGE